MAVLHGGQGTSGSKDYDHFNVALEVSTFGFPIIANISLLTH